MSWLQRQYWFSRQELRVHFCLCILLQMDLSGQRYDIPDSLRICLIVLVSSRM